MTAIFSRDLFVISLIALVAVMTHWDVWDQGVLAMSWNSSLVWLFLGFQLFRSNKSIDFHFDWI